MQFKIDSNGQIQVYRDGRIEGIPTWPTGTEELLLERINELEVEVIQLEYERDRSVRRSKKYAEQLDAVEKGVKFEFDETTLKPISPNEYKKWFGRGDMIEWTDCIKYGPPDTEGFYLCAFTDGSVETFTYDLDDIEWWFEPNDKGIRVKYWADQPPHPDTVC